MTQTNLAIAADCADSLLTARRAKIVLFLLILLALLAQLSLFFTVRYGYPKLLEAPANAADHTNTQWLQYAIGLLDFAGLILPALLTINLFVILQVQLVGRLLGTARMTAAVIWSALLTLLLFPWQAVLNNPAISADPLTNALGAKIPGVLYTWAEFSNSRVGALFSVKGPWADSTMHWARFVGFPVLAVLILIWIQFKSDGGLRQSMGKGAMALETNPVR